MQKTIQLNCALPACLQNYVMFNLLNKEFTFTVNDGELDCGLNGALYFVEMQKDGGLSEYPTNGAGAAYGTGYCDAQVSKNQKGNRNQTNSFTPNLVTSRHFIACRSAYLTTKERV